MITKQQQLEWLANNLEKWKSGYDYAVVEKASDGYLYIRWPSVCASGITKKEWQQERDKMQKKAKQAVQDNLWHEHGELPPVGTICEMIDDIAMWRECKIIAHENGACIGWVTSLNAPFYTYNKSELRPLSTEREKAINEMNELVGNIEKYPTWRDAMTALYDAGYRKVASK